MTARRFVRMLASIIIAVAMLFIGWGIRDAKGFLASPARVAFVIALVADMFLGMTVMRAKPFRKGVQTPGGQAWVFGVLQIVTIGLLLFLPFADRRGVLVTQAEWVRWLGLALFVAGVVILVLALRTLGENYSVYVTIQEEHHLVQSGIYGMVRHPIYLANLLTWPAACLVFRSWLVIPMFAFFLAFAALRGAQEERVLLEHFGGDFQAYCRRTWRLVPYLY